MQRSRRQPIPFAVFGLQRSGTNLASALLKLNFVARPVGKWMPWKHGPIGQLRTDWGGAAIRFVVCVRNPYAWLVSCYRYFQKAYGRDPTIPPDFGPSTSFEQFVTGESYGFANAVERWNRMYRHWLSTLPPEHMCIVRQEDQLLDQVAVLERLRTKLNIPQRAARLRGINKRIDIIPGCAEPINRDYYLDREYMLEYSPTLLHGVNQALDGELLGEFGYRREQWALQRQQVGGLDVVVRPLSSDCAVAQTCATDLHDFEQINRWSAGIERIVVLGAHIGTSAVLARRYWPQSRVLAYESCLDRYRILQINARTARGIDPVHAIVSDGQNGTGPAHPPTLDLEHCFSHFGGEIDVLRLGDVDSALSLMIAAHRRGLLTRVRWICGRLSGEPDARTLLIDCLSDSHSIELRAVPGGECFLAHRLRRPRIRAESAAGVQPDRLTEQTAYDAATRFIESIGEYPASRFRGRGVVICGGGRQYFPCAWVCINMLRHVGCTLPIELWGLNAEELDSRMRQLVEPLGVRCVDASRVRKRYPARILDGWELKPYSIIHSRFKEVLFLDADNVAVTDPTVLFESREYRDQGAVFWPAYGPYEPDDPIWRICRVPYRKEPDFETGQIVIDKSRCWKPLQLTMHLNENSDFYYQYTQGDKETFHMAWRMLNQSYAMISTPVEKVFGAAWQHDFQGRRMFQHRYEAKWSLDEANPVIAGFLHEERCFEFLDSLRPSHEL